MNILYEYYPISEKRFFEGLKDTVEKWIKVPKFQIWIQSKERC